MREIKFRAWDLEKKEWIGNNGTTFTSENPIKGVVALILSGHLRVFSASLMRGEKEEDDLLSVAHSEYESVPPCHTEPSYKRQYVLCQYTDLKDKNGKEIYEGDVVGGTHDYLDEVIWSNERGQWMLDNGINPDDTLWEIHRDNDIEIIGNIHENPELMEKK